MLAFVAASAIAVAYGVIGLALLSISFKQACLASKTESLFSLVILYNTLKLLYLDSVKM